MFLHSVLLVYDQKHMNVLKMVVLVLVVGLEAVNLLLLVEKNERPYMNKNGAVMQLNISKPAFAVDTSWRG